MSTFLCEIITDYEVYFRAHARRVAAYADHFRDVDANADVQTMGE